MNKLFTKVLSFMIALTAVGSIIAANPFAPTGDEVVKGKTQLLYYTASGQGNPLSGAANLGEGADGWSMQIMVDGKNLASGSDITIDGVKYKGIKLSNGAQTKVTLPEGYVANAVTIYSTVNSTDVALNYWAEVDGTTYDKPAESTLTSLKNGAEPDVSYFKLSGDKNYFTIQNSGKQPVVVLKVDYSEAPTTPEEPEEPVTPEDPTTTFGEAALAAPVVYPSNNSAMLNLTGAITLTFAENVETVGKATLNDTECELVANETEVYVTYAGLTPSTEYTLTIPAGAIGNAEKQNTEALTYKFTTRQEGVLYYADFKNYPEGFYNAYSKGGKQVDVIAKNSTDKTLEVGGLTFYSGTKGRVVAMLNVNGATSESDYGPETDADAGASNNAVQLIDGGNGLYMQLPEVEGPVDVTFYLASTGQTAPFSVVLTDENGDTKNPLTTFELPAGKKMKKVTYSYPYKGAVSLRLYNMKNKVDVNDIIIVKGEGEGIEKPVNKDETAPQLLYSWPSSTPYAPIEGTIELIYNENIAISGKASISGTDADITVNDKVATIAYSGLENGKTYTVTIPAVADEAGNANEPFDITFTTEAADVLYYTDFASFPFSYWEKYHGIPNDAGDNEDIIAKNSNDVTAVAGGITYFSGTAGRVVAMGKSNLKEDNSTDDAGATARCIQIQGGGNGLYLQLPAVEGPADITFWAAPNAANATLELRNGEATEALASFSAENAGKTYKFTYHFDGATPVDFRLYNMGNQFNIYDILVVKAEPESTFGEAALDAPVVYPSNNSAMLNLAGAITLTFAENVETVGKATLNDTECELVANETEVYVTYAGLTPSTEYTLTIPAGAIGNAEKQNTDALTYKFTTRQEGVLYYADFKNYPEGFYNAYSKDGKQVDVIAKGSTDVTVEVGGMTFYSGTKGRVVAMLNVNGATSESDYGPETDEDAGASNNAVQLIDGGNGLYMQLPEVEGPVDVTFYLASTGQTAPFSVVLTDENGDTKNPLATFELPAGKKMKKVTYSYPYKGAVSLRLYNMKNKVDVNDVLIVKGEGEGLDKPVIKDEEAPVLLYSWPSDAPYSPLEGSLTLIYNEEITVDGKAKVGDVETDMVVEGKTATIAFEGLEAGKTYTVEVPAVADEAGNKTEPLTMTIATAAADVLYYTDFGSFPYAYWDKFHTYPNDAADNEDIIAKNSNDVTAEVAGITYFSGTAGRVVAMGKSNLKEDNSADDAGATARCIQIQGGGNGLYLQLPAVEGPADITFWAAPNAANATLELHNGEATEALATFSAENAGKTYKFTYHFDEEDPADFRLYNMGNQFNIYDILVVKSVKSGIISVSADADSEAVYYNLQGIRVDNPANGIYIRVRGKVVDKVVVR